MANTRFNKNSGSRLQFIILFLIVSFTSLMLKAQAPRPQLDKIILNKVKLWDDSVRKAKLRKTPLYLGGELALAFPQYNLRSKISALHGLHVNYMGTNLGGMISSPLGKLKASAGFFYSDPSVPYTMQMLQGGISGNLYFLRLKKIKYHTFEPYAKAGFTHQQTKFYGNYLTNNENNGNGVTNYSSTDQPLLGLTGFTQMNLGAGVEYQLENCHNLFVHLFAEFEYGLLISSSASNRAFTGTTLSNPTAFSFGINFGIIK